MTERWRLTSTKRLRDSKGCQQSVNRFLVAIDNREDTIGEDRLPSRVRRAKSQPTGLCEGLRYDGVFPWRWRWGKNHIGTIAGKLKGEITPTTPRAYAIETHRRRSYAFRALGTFDEVGNTNTRTQQPLDHARFRREHPRGPCRALR